MKDEDIKEFSDPAHWLSYFPPHCKADLQRMGLKVWSWVTFYFETHVVFLHQVGFPIGRLAQNFYHDRRKPLLRFIRPVAIQTLEESQQSSIWKKVASNSCHSWCLICTLGDKYFAFSDTPFSHPKTDSLAWTTIVAVARSERKLFVLHYFI